MTTSRRSPDKNGPTSEEPRSFAETDPDTQTPSEVLVTPGFFTERSCGSTSRLVAYAAPEYLAAAFGARADAGILCFPTDDQDCPSVQKILAEIGFVQVHRLKGLSVITEQKLHPQNGFCYRENRGRREVVLFGEEELLQELSPFYWLYGDLAVSVHGLCEEKAKIFWTLCVEDECSAFWKVDCDLANLVISAYRSGTTGRPVFNMEHESMMLRGG